MNFWDCLFHFAHLLETKKQLQLPQEINLQDLSDEFPEKEKEINQSRKSEIDVLLQDGQKDGTSQIVLDIPIETQSDVFSKPPEPARSNLTMGQNNFPTKMFIDIPLQTGGDVSTMKVAYQQLQEVT